jgi:hypothetical protein
MRDVGRRADRYREEAQAPGDLSRRRADDDQESWQESWISGYSAFWQDLAAAWLVAVLIAGVVLVVQSSKDPLRNIDPATATAQMPPAGKAIRSPAHDEPGGLECTNLDHAYGRC